MSLDKLASNHNSGGNSSPGAGLPEFFVTLSTSTVTKTATDFDVVGFITLTLEKPIERSTVFSIVAQSVDATASDYILESTTITLAAGETSKTVKLTVKGNSGSKDWDKQVVLKFTNADGYFKTSEVTKNFTITDSRPLLLAVNPFYPAHGNLWNTYATNSGGLRLVSPYLRLKAENFPASPVLCSTTAAQSCFHLGELKKVVVSSRKTCTNLTMVDSENAFEWRCSDATAPVYFYSVGFKKGKGLKDLITAAGTDWKNMTVTVSESASSLGSSTGAKWWGNPVSMYNSGTINSGGAAARLDLNVANTVYVFNGTLQSRGFTLNADGVSVVTLAGSSVTATGTIASVDCDTTSGPVDDCFFNVNSKHRVWIEGTYVGLSSVPVFRTNYFMTYYNSIRFHAARLSGGTFIMRSGGLSNTIITESTLSGGSYSYYGIANSNNVFADVNVEKASVDGISITSTSSFSALVNVKISNVAADALKFDGSFGGGSQVQISNSGTGIKGSSNSSSFFNSIASNNSGAGIDSSGGDFVLANNSSFGNGTYGATFGYGYFSPSRHHQLLAANNTTGFYFSTAGTEINVIDSASIDNANDEIEFANNTSNIKFRKKLYIGRNSNPCLTGTGTSNINITGVNCTPVVTGTPAITTNLNANDVFQSFTIDTTNPNGSAGITGVAPNSISDWFNFESGFRFWAPLSLAALPNATVRSRCTSGTCGIYDLKIKSGSHGFKNYNGTFVAGAACPASTKGSNATKYTYNASEISGLTAAAEFLLDGIGNDNGICEAGETCYFLPDMGANIFDLQALKDTCIYDADGSALTGITIYGK